MKLTNVLISLLSSSAEEETAERIMRSASDATIDESVSSPLAQMIMPDKLDTERGGFAIFRELQVETHWPRKEEDG